MKTKFWVGLLALLAVLCAVLSVWLLGSDTDAAYVRVLSEGKLQYTLPLNVDTSVTVETQRGTNVVTVRDGKVAVTQASCPDGHCMHRGFCSGGAQIVCLPNRLVLEFVGQQTVDAVVG